MSPVKEHASEQIRGMLAAVSDGTPTEQVRTMLTDVQLLLERVDTGPR